MKEVKIVARYYADGTRMTEDEFKKIIFSHYMIDKVLANVNKRLGLK